MTGVDVFFALMIEESLVRCWTSTSDQVIVVDVDHLNRLVLVVERNGPVGSDHLVVVHRALVVAVMQAGRSNEWVEAAVVHSVDDWLDNHLDIAALSFCDEGVSARRFVRDRSHHFIRARWVLAEDVRMFPFNGIQDGNLVVPFFTDICIFDQLAVPRTHRDQRRRSIETAEYEGVFEQTPHQHGAGGGCQQTAAAGHRHQADPDHQGDAFEQ